MVPVLAGKYTEWFQCDFRRKVGPQLLLHHRSSPLMLHKALQEQGIVSKTASLSCTYVPTDLYAAWSTVRSIWKSASAELALQGVTGIAGAATKAYLAILPQTLEHLTCARYFNQSLKGVTLPSSLQRLTFRDIFNQSLEGMALASSLQSLTFGEWFNQSLEGVALPSSLQSLTFGERFNQSLEGVTLPSSLQSLLFGERFNQSLEGVTLPSSLQSLSF